MEITVSDGSRLYVERKGEGAACLYLHGGPGYWSKSFSRTGGTFLEDKLEMIYLDQRGCGRSGPAEDFTLLRMIEDIEEIRRTLGIDSWFVMGHSFGGILAAVYAKRHSERVKGLILLNAVLDMKDSFQHQLRIGSAWLELEAKPNAEEWLEQFFVIQGKLLEENRYFSLQFRDIGKKQLLDEIDQKLSGNGAMQQAVFSSAAYFQDFTKLSTEIQLPVLIVAGTHDHAAGPDHHRNFRFPNAEVCLLESGHHPYIEEPDKFRQAVLEFCC